MSAFPKSEKALVGLGTIHLRRGDFTRALSLFSEAAEQPEASIDSQVCLANCLSDMGKFEASLSIVRHLIGQYPDLALLRSTIGLIYRKMGDYHNSIAAYDEELKLQPSTLSAFNRRAYCLAKLDRLEDAVADYCRVLEVEPNNKHALFNRGICLQRLGKLGQAISDFTTCHELDPNDPSPLFSRASCLQAMGSKAKAVNDFNHASQLTALRQC